MGGLRTEQGEKKVSEIISSPRPCAAPGLFTVTDLLIHPYMAAYPLSCEGASLKKITIDTNLLPADDFIEIAKVRGYEVGIGSVTERELGSSNSPLNVPELGRVLELGIVGESRVGSCVVGSGSDYLEIILQTISNRSFPKSGNRGRLTDGQRRQLRDAMILEAHAREGRDIFVTNDKKGFIDDGRREKLQSLLKTRILTREEFLRELRG